MRPNHDRGNPSKPRRLFKFRLGFCFKKWLFHHLLPRSNRNIPYVSISAPRSFLLLLSVRVHKPLHPCTP